MITMLKKVFVLLLFFPLFSYAQYGQRGYWNMNILASSSSFLSDLGGKNALGTNDFSDLDLNRTRYAFGLGVTYNIGTVGVEMGSFYTRLMADDALTTSKRGRRQLSVRTDLIETYTKLNFRFPSRVPVIGNIYFGAGIGFIYFNPKAELNGNWYSLRPLGTEGQNFMPGQSQYGKFAPVIPFSVGRQFNFRDGSSLSLELNMRKSFTDYLDDVSTTYANPAQIAEAAGPVAAALADRSENGITPGKRRGDPTDLDNYFLLGFKYNIPLGAARNSNTSCAFSDSWFNSGGRRFRHRSYRRRLFR